MSSNPQQFMNKALSSKALKNTNTNANHKPILTNEKRKIEKQQLSKQKPHHFKLPTKLQSIDIKGSATLNPTKTVIKNNQNIHHIKANQYPIGQIKKKPFQNNININANINNMTNFKNTQIKSEKQIKIQKQIGIQNRSKSGNVRKQEKRQTQKALRRKDLSQNTEIIEELNLLCDQEIQQQISVSQHSHRSYIQPKNQYSNKLQKTFKSQLMNQRKEQRYSIIQNKMQKKQNQQFSNIGIQKIQSQHGTSIIKNKNYQGIQKVQSAINFKQQLKKFQKEEQEINNVFELQKFHYLQNIHRKYQVQSNYIQKKQKKAFTWQMRIVLVDWMMQVCYQFRLQRDTFHLAVGITDKYFQTVSDLERADFQLAGAAAMFIAAKIQQQNALSSEQFSRSTNQRYSQDQIKKMELNICKALHFQLNPPTLSMWANRIMAQWDVFLEMSDAKYHPYFHNHAFNFFKQSTNEAYLNFRTLMQYVDCAVLDIQTQQYSPKILVCSFMYLVLGQLYNQWNVKTIVNKFPFSSTYLIGDSNQYFVYNHLFHSFVMNSFNIQLIQLLPAIQYCATFFILQLSYQCPNQLDQEDQPHEFTFIQYQALQTYNNRSIQTVRKRTRQI